MTEPTGSPPSPPRVPPARMPSPPALLKDRRVWKAAVYFALSGPVGLAWFVVLAAGVPLAAATTIIWVGLPLWALLLVLLRFGSVLDRRLVGLAFETPIESPYRRIPGGSLLSKGRTILGDPATWKDLAFQVVRIPLSFAYFTGSLVGWALTGALILAPIGGRINEGFVPEFGSHRPSINAWYEGLPYTALGLLCLVVLLYSIKAVGLMHVLLARLLLGPSEKQALRARTFQLQASRARGVDAAEAERRRIERDLHDGAQQRLLGVAMDIGRARTKIETDPDQARRLIEQAHDGARAAIAELRDLARGIYPAILTDRGLEAALSALAARAPVPVLISVELPERPPAAVESIAYFTVAEALTNIAKHAAAERAAVTVAREGDRVVVEIRDDGRGGAGLSPGGGLAGLADRAATIDGTLTLESPAGGPTVVRVVLPCSW